MGTKRKWGIQVSVRFNSYITVKSVNDIDLG